MNPTKTRRKGLREIDWMCNCVEKVCIYDNGHILPNEFLARVRGWVDSDVPQENREALSSKDVRHLQFRPMSPTEAHQYGLDYGVVETDKRGYPVTAVLI